MKNVLFSSVVSDSLSMVRCIASNNTRIVHCYLDVSFILKGFRQCITDTAHSLWANVLSPTAREFNRLQGTLLTAFKRTVIGLHP